MTRIIAPDPAAFGLLPPTVTRFDTRAMQSVAPDLVTTATVARMALYAREGSRAPAVRAATADALRGLPPKTPAGQIAAQIWHWVKAHVQFVADEEICWAASLDNTRCDETEWLIRPELLLAMPTPQGDCDDFAMLTCAMLLAAGLDCEFVTVAADRRDPGRFSHVYATARFPGGGSLPMDTSHGRHPGWEVQDVSRRVGWGGLGLLPSRLQGLAIDDQVLGGRRTGGTRLTRTGGMGQADLSEYMIGGNPPWWQSLLSTGERIAVARFGQPPAGTFYQTGPGGTVYQRTDPRLGFNPPFVGPGMPSWLLLGGGLIALVVLVSALGRGR